MFSSLTSILPSGIGFGAKSDAAQMRVNDDKTPHPRDYERFPEEGPEAKTAGNTDEMGVKKKRERNPYEVSASLAIPYIRFINFLSLGRSHTVSFSLLHADIHCSTTPSISVKSSVESATTIGSSSSQRTRGFWFFNRIRLIDSFYPPIGRYHLYCPRE